MRTAPDAIVEHTRENIVRLRQVARTLFTYGRADVWLCHHHPDQRVPHTNVATLSTAVTILGLLATRWLKVSVLAGPVFAAGLVAVRTARRHRQGRRTAPATSDPYGRRMHQEPLAPGASPDLFAVARTACMVCVDAMFDLGTMVEALRRRQFANLFGRFHYLDPRDFEVQDTPDVPPAAVAPTGKA